MLPTLRMDVLITSELEFSPKENAATGRKQNPRHMAQMCAVDVQLLKMNLENIVPREGSFEGWLSVILGWENWKALDRSP